MLNLVQSYSSIKKHAKLTNNGYFMMTLVSPAINIVSGILNGKVSEKSRVLQIRTEELFARSDAGEWFVVSSKSWLVSIRCTASVCLFLIKMEQSSCHRPWHFAELSLYCRMQTTDRQRKAESSDSYCGLTL